MWSTDWWHDPSECLAKIEAAIEWAQTARAASPAPTAANCANENPDAVTCDPIWSSVESDPEPVSDREGAPPVYRAYKSRRLFGARQEFYDTRAAKAVQELVETIVREEGPVSIEVLCRRVAQGWVFARIGGTIRERIRRVLRGCSVRVTPQPHGTFLWPMNLEPSDYRSFRVPGAREDEQRGIDEIPMEELIAAACHVLREQVSLPRGDLVRETALLFGFRRTGATIQRIVAHAVDRAVEMNEIQQVEGGRVRLGP